MPKPLNVNREEIRQLVLVHGVREAARLTNLSFSTIGAWSRRFGWLKTAHTPIAPVLPASMQPTTHAAYVAPADALAARLGEDEKETRISLSKAARNLAKKAETAELNEAPFVLAGAKVSSLVHRWESQPAQTCSVSSVRIENGVVVINQQFNSDGNSPA